MNSIVRTLVPFFVEHLAAQRAVQCPHVNQLRAAGGHVAHVTATSPRWDRARAALGRALIEHEASQADKNAALAAAVEILRDETTTREAGRVWDADAAVRTWQARGVFDAAYEASQDPEERARIELLRAYFTDPRMRARIADFVAAINGVEHG
jgi:hypothetical protein